MLTKTIEAMKNKTDKADKILIISMHPTVFCEPPEKYTCGKKYMGGKIFDDESREDEKPEYLAWGNFEKDRLWLTERKGNSSFRTCP